VQVPRAATLILPQRCRAELLRAACASWPAEACGVLVGRLTAHAAAVARLGAARSLVQGPAAAHRFELDPADFTAAWATAERDRLQVLGVWHSHPHGDAVPSAMDGDAAWEGYAWLIAAVAADGVRELRSWCLERGVWTEQRIARDRVPPAEHSR
jgi:proteasome lid subunit RPN8/RPN11